MPARGDGAPRDAELEEVLAERNRLWAELNRRAARDHEVEHLRRTLADLEGSISWRITKPLRDGRGAVRRARSLAGKARRSLRGS